MKMRIKMIFRKCLVLCLAGGMVFAAAGCNHSNKEPKPEPKSTAKIDKGNAEAEGTGGGQADVPLVAGTDSFSKVFNPFVAETEADRQAVDLTQIKLVTNDRAGKLIYKGIDGELRKYHGEEYTYYAPSDLSIQYDKKNDTTVYHIKLREDLSFSDGQKLTIDDVLFSLYVLCDNSYTGDLSIKEMPIKGLLDYQANSTKAERFTDKNLAKQMKKHGKKFRRWLMAQGYSSLAAQVPGGNTSVKNILGKIQDYQELFRQGRIYFSKGKGKKVKSISGIQKLGDYELSIETKGYQRRMSAALQIPVCALHYYGDVTKFQPADGSFGFRRGDISSVLANKSTPMGAGAYRFVKYEDGVAYFTSNELYFLGCPQTAYLQLKEMPDILEETRKNLEQKLAAESSTQGEKQDADETSAPTVNPSEEVTELQGGTVDVLRGTFRGEEFGWITDVNSNGELEGTTIATRIISDGIYRYVGIHGKNVSVGGQADSEASKSLRRAIAMLFSAGKTALAERDGIGVDMVSYPLGNESWLIPGVEDAQEYVNIFERDYTGEELYSPENKARERLEAVREEVLRALQDAGYTVEDGKVVKAPAGASTSYCIWIANGEENPFYDMVAQVAGEFQAIGMNLQIEGLQSVEVLQERLAGGSQQLWIGMRNISDVDLQGRYASSGRDNLFGIEDAELNGYLENLQTYLTSEQRRQAYQKCIEQMLTWAVEVPLCEYQDALLFSSSRIQQTSIPNDLTPYYGWINEVQKIRMK